jgi:hypothetical protein
MAGAKMSASTCGFDKQRFFGGRFISTKVAPEALIVKAPKQSKRGSFRNQPLLCCASITTSTIMEKYLCTDLSNDDRRVAFKDRRIAPRTTALKGDKIIRSTGASSRSIDAASYGG